MLFLSKSINKYKKHIKLNETYKIIGFQDLWGHPGLSPEAGWEIFYTFYTFLQFLCFFYTFLYFFMLLLSKT